MPVGVMQHGESAVSLLDLFHSWVTGQSKPLQPEAAVVANGFGLRGLLLCGEEAGQGAPSTEEVRQPGNETGVSGMLAAADQIEPTLNGAHR